ncbi:MAG TPA: ATP-binding protein [Anaerolineaceae bacterium]
MDSLNLPNLKPANVDREDLTRRLQDFRAEITRRAALALMVVAGASAWMVTSLNPFPGWALLVLLGLFGLAWVARRNAEEHPDFSRYALFAGGLAGCFALMAAAPENWIPFVTLPVIFLGSILVNRGEWIAGGITFSVVAGMTWLGWREYPLLAFAVAVMLTVMIAWVVIFMLNTSLGWYQVMLDQANRLLGETREHRGELSRVLKNLKLANDLQRRTEQELILARKSAEESRIAKEKFAAKVSHELRTPLALISGFSEVMYNSPEIYGDVTWTPTMRRDIAQIYHNSNHLLEMVDDILNLSRFEVAGFTISLEDVDLNDLLSETAGIARDLFRTPAVRFITDFPSDLPVLRIDRTRIRQVILNLLNNARRFTEEGEVCLSASVTEQEVVIRVRDTGPGIPADKLTQIFQEFYQVEDHLLRKKGGSGLGLAICKHFVEIHGGHIWAESQVGVGSTFHFALPVGGAYLGSREVEEMPARAGEPGRVLLIGADEHVLAMLRSKITSFDFILIENESTIDQAVALYHPRAILWNDLPEQAERVHLLAGNTSVPVLRCSLPSTLWLIRKLGIHACLAKPLRREMIERELARLPGARRILLVDDDEDFVQFVQRLLQTLNADYEVIMAGDGRRGVELARSSQPDLMLLDLTMPEMDGFQVIAALKDDPATAQIPIVLLTATLTPERLMVFSGNRLVVERPDEMRVIETLNLVKATLDVLEARYQETTDEIITRISEENVPSSSWESPEQSDFIDP